MLMKSIKIKHSYNSSTLFLCFRSSFSEFASKYGKDERFKGIEKMRERESIFSDYCSDLRRKEKEEKSSQKEKVGHLVGIVSNAENLLMSMWLSNIRLVPSTSLLKLVLVLIQ